jgi:hypothetical protein
MWPSAFALWIVFALPFPDPDPPVQDLIRFPRSELVELLEKFHKAHLESMKRRWLWDVGQRPIIAAISDQAESLWQPWDTLRDAQWASHYINGEGTTRKHLMSLRKQLGEDAYNKGEMPPYCAWWLFHGVER